MRLVTTSDGREWPVTWCGAGAESLFINLVGELRDHEAAEFAAAAGAGPLTFTAGDLRDVYEGYGILEASMPDAWSRGTTLVTLKREDDHAD